MPVVVIDGRNISWDEFGRRHARGSRDRMATCRRPAAPRGHQATMQRICMSRC
jgi:hypothetical protein